MYLLDKIAETRIQECIESGGLDDLSGAGGPLQFDDDSMVPESLRAAYRILKNSGYLPAEAAIYSEIRDVETLIGRMDHGEERVAAAKRLSLLRARLGSERCSNLAVQEHYFQTISEKLGE
jgi:hypothetical protein